MKISTHRSLRNHLPVVIVLVAFASAGGCRQVVVPNAAPTRAQIAELWVEPSPSRDLFIGVGGRALMPRPDALFKVTAVKSSGFSEGYTVVDPRGREWSAKFPPEATTEVVASRLFWGLGLPSAADLPALPVAGRGREGSQSAASGTLPREEAGVQRSR